MKMFHLGFTGQLLLLQLFTQPFLLLDEVQLLLLQVNDCLLRVLQSPQDFLNVGFLLASPIISQLGQFLYLELQWAFILTTRFPIRTFLS